MPGIFDARTNVILLNVQNSGKKIMSGRGNEPNLLTLYLPIDSIKPFCFISVQKVGL